MTREILEAHPLRSRDTGRFLAENAGAGPGGRDHAAVAARETERTGSALAEAGADPESRICAAYWAY